jgi:hypothetical protein
MLKQLLLLIRPKTLKQLLLSTRLKSLALPLSYFDIFKDFISEETGAGIKTRPKPNPDYFI